MNEKKTTERSQNTSLLYLFNCTATARKLWSLETDVVFRDADARVRPRPLKFECRVLVKFAHEPSRDRQGAVFFPGALTNRLLARAARIKLDQYRIPDRNGP